MNLHANMSCAIWCLTVWAISGVASADLPVVVVDRDNFEITRSCIVTIESDHIIDADVNGVIHINSDAVVVDFAGARLHGAAPDQLPDTFKGIGVKINANLVEIRNLNVSGYKVGIRAENADGLHIHNCDVSNNFHQRLKSTPRAEDASDWLWPHANDNDEWITNYGAGIAVKNATAVLIHNVRARKSQNGIILDRVNDSKIYDNDCSFLSGWGLALWRSNRNVISRNAFDFCVRGYSHGVYNRGQDSAGILMFEQCSENVIAENSATHGGDGFFGFAGKEALGEVNLREDQAWYRERGHVGNRFIRNDFSYAAAHGLELTFSFRNQIIENRFVENAICGIWGGYSQGTLIALSEFVGNGGMAYGKERGGINIEHGRFNSIHHNVFRKNAAGIVLWWDDDRALLRTPWAKANDPLSTDNTIALNRFQENTVNIELRHTPVTLEAMNELDDQSKAWSLDEHSTTKTYQPTGIEMRVPEYPVFGKSGPVGARATLRGRENIIMTEWGPWDHESPLLRFQQRAAHVDEYRLFKADVPAADRIGVDGRVSIDIVPDENRIIVHPVEKNLLAPYVISFDVEGVTLTARGTLTSATWDVNTFASACDPRDDAARWRREGLANAHSFTAESLDFRFGAGGPTQIENLSVDLPRDHFGVIATRTLTIPAGKWRITTTSDDGIRVWMDDQLIIDDWTWHGPTRHSYEFDVTAPREHNFRVEYFELDGYAILGLEFDQIQ